MLENIFYVCSTAIMFRIINKIAFLRTPKKRRESLAFPKWPFRIKKNNVKRVRRGNASKIILKFTHPAKNVNSSPLQMHIKANTKTGTRKFIFTKKSEINFVCFEYGEVSEREEGAFTHCTHMCYLIDSAVMIKSRKKCEWKEKERNYQKNATLHAAIIFLALPAILFLESHSERQR